MPKQEYKDMYEVVGLHTERDLYLPEIDDFILLNQDNYKDYIEDNYDY